MTDFNDPSAVPPPGPEVPRPPDPVPPNPSPPASPAPFEDVPMRPPAIGCGVFLIVLGAAIVAGRLIPGIDVWEMWPLIIVAFGIRNMVTEGKESESRIDRAIEGLATVSVGMIFLGNTTGSLSWGVWLSVFSLWPLLLIAAGLQIVGKGMQARWLQVLSSLLILGGLLFGALVLPSAGFSPSFGLAGPRVEPFSFSEKADSDVDTGEVSLTGAVGETTIEAGRDLVTAEGSTPFGEPSFDVATRGSHADVEISLGESGVWIGHQGQSRLELELSEDVEWDIVIKSGVSRLDADLSELDIRDLAVSSGVTESEVRLGVPDRSAGIVPISIGSGVSAVRIFVPEEVAFKVHAAAGLANVEIGGGGGPTIGGRTYETSNYDRARTGYEIDVSSGVSNVIVETY